MTAPLLHILGTGSGVGKSVLVAGLCRLLTNRGMSVAPFKAQNMALNSAATAEGHEIGRSQALQAIACRRAPSVLMNPILLKPGGRKGCQVVLNGHPLRDMDSQDYRAFKSEARRHVDNALNELRKTADLVIMEGAGSPAEVNLRDGDIVNMDLALRHKAPVLLVGDIDRGGVFAWLAGTLSIFTSEELALVKGLIINRFRGDPTQLQSGLDWILNETGVPVLGVVHHLNGLNLPEEDGLALDAPKAETPNAEVTIGVIRFPHIANFTDVEPLEQDPRVQLRYIEAAHELEGAQAVILPGTKNTFRDLGFLRSTGMDRAILAHAEAGKTVIGVCGGYQMLGEKIHDPHGVESGGTASGLGLLPITTEMAQKKATWPVTVQDLRQGDTFSAYEIHHGRTQTIGSTPPLFRILTRGTEPCGADEGHAHIDRPIWGTYLHGLFDHPAIQENLLRSLGATPMELTDPSADLDQRLDRLATHLETALDVDALLAMATAD